MFLLKLSQKQTILLEEDAEMQCELHAFIDSTFSTILSQCGSEPHHIIRDYVYVPHMLDLKKVEKELKKLIKENPKSMGYVNAWISTDRVLNWCVDHVKGRV